MRNTLPYASLAVNWIVCLVFVTAAFLCLNVVQNITPVDSLVKLAGTDGCYKYLGWQNGHILKNLDTEELTSVWIKPIIRVQSCGESGD